MSGSVKVGTTAERQICGLNVLETARSAERAQESVLFA
jgi:hypothetical protein